MIQVLYKQTAYKAVFRRVQCVYAFHENYPFFAENSEICRKAQATQGVKSFTPLSDTAA